MDIACNATSGVWTTIPLIDIPMNMRTALHACTVIRGMTTDIAWVSTNCNRRCTSIITQYTMGVCDPFPIPVPLHYMKKFSHGPEKCLYGIFHDCLHCFRIEEGTGIVRVYLYEDRSWRYVHILSRYVIMI